jgi:hypothetical protein
VYAPLNIFDIAKAEEPPRRPKTIDTVVLVGIPNVLKISIRITSVAETARKMQMTLSNV